MSNKTRVNVTVKSDTAIGVVVGADVTVIIDDHVEGAVYVNACNELIGQVLSELGKLFTEYNLEERSGQSPGAARDSLDGRLTALRMAIATANS